MKKLSLITLIATLAVLLASCDFNNSTSAEFEYAGMHITLVNAQEENLLDPNTVGHVNKSDVRVLYESPSGELTEFCHGSNPTPCNLRFDNLEMYVMVYHYGRPDESTTYLKLSETDIDTIYCQFASGDGYYKISDIWYNDQHIDEFATVDDAEVNRFTVVK